MAEQVLYEIILKGYEDVSRRIENVGKELAAAKKEAKALSDQLDDPANADAVDSLSKAYKAQTATIQKLGAEYGELSREQRRQTSIAVEGLRKENGSIDEKSKRLGNLKAAYRQLSEAQRNDISIGGVHLKQIQKLDQEVKDLDASIGNYQRNVGNYQNLKAGAQDAIGNAIGGTDIGTIVQAGMAGGVGGAVAAGVAVSIAGALALADEAAAAELQMAKNVQVLGSSLFEVEKEAQKVANSFGMTRKEFVSNTAAVADLLKPMGFATDEAARFGVEVTKLSAPLAAWSRDGKTASEVTNTVIAALTGERDGLKSLGIVIDEATIKQKLLEQGKSKLTGEALKQAEAEVVLAEVTRQSADAIATYANNGDSLARQNAEMSASWEDLKDTLIKSFTPAIRDVIGWIATATKQATTFIDEMGTFKSTGGFWGTVAVGALNVTGNSAQAIALETQLKAKESLRLEDQERARVLKLITDIEAKENVTFREATELYEKRVAAANKAQQVQRVEVAEGTKASSKKVKEAEAEAGSVKQLTNALSELRAELEKTNQASPKFNQLKTEIDALTTKLEVAKTMIDGQSRAQGQSVTAPMATPNLLPISIKDPTTGAAIPTNNGMPYLSLEEQQAERDKIQAQNEADRQLEIQKTQEGLAALSAIGNDALEVNSAIQAQQLAEIEKRYAREIEAAKGNATLISRLEKQRDAEKARIEKQAFERAKKLQIAAATIQLASGIVNILASPTVIPEPFGAIFKGVQVAALVATTAAQIAQISAAEFFEGGFTSNGNSRDVAGIVHKNEYVIPARVLSTTAGSQIANELEAMRLGRSFSAPTYSGNSDMSAQIAAAVTSAIQSIPVIVTVPDIENGMTKRALINQSGKL